MGGVGEEVLQVYLPSPTKAQVGSKLQLLLLEGRVAGRKSEWDQLNLELSDGSDLRRRSNCVQAGGGHCQLVLLARAEGSLKISTLVKREYMHIYLMGIQLEIYIRWEYT